MKSKKERNPELDLWANGTWQHYHIFYTWKEWSSGIKYYRIHLNRPEHVTKDSDSFCWLLNFTQIPLWVFWFVCLFFGNKSLNIITSTLGYIPYAQIIADNCYFWLPACICGSCSLQTQELCLEHSSPAILLIWSIFNTIKYESFVFIIMIMSPLKATSP